jgi:hypothetical protein
MNAQNTTSPIRYTRLFAQDIPMPQDRGGNEAPFTTLTKFQRRQVQKQGDDQI